MRARGLGDVLLLIVIAFVVCPAILAGHAIDGVLRWRPWRRS